MRQRNVSTTNLVALRPLKNYLKFPFFLFVLLLAAASLSGCVTSAGTGVVVGPDPYYRPYPRPYYRAYPRPYYHPRRVIVAPAPRPYYHGHPGRTYRGSRPR
ncbi:hypothetical protein [Hymenobacter mucosus]|uniref:hypothetical protein n=1 Tax=Hymenobacter mucosus TaxID=1411120 RepID=UPI00117BD3BF|nr:hypothetical protein [Hymenobacter mucosus]